MATIKDITTLCKAGQIQEAYETAKADLLSSPSDIWAERAVGWALYYMIKDSADRCDIEKMLSGIEELKALEALDTDNDALIYDNVLFKVAEIVRNKIVPNSPSALEKLPLIFNSLRDIQFKPSKAYSFLLQGFIKNDGFVLCLCLI
jgi:hypothetical protein